mmetsp:Transcript_63173/g.148384  ORF Transcript_63173/g.148384 Transcript_63173/m.148384 type:complete len:215 (-) Transcript_63173:680-1324(-)
MRAEFRVNGSGVELRHLDLANIALKIEARRRLRLPRAHFLHQLPELLLHRVSNPAHHDLNHVLVHVLETDCVSNQTFYLRLIRWTPCFCMLRIHAAQGLDDLLDPGGATPNLLLHRDHGRMRHGKGHRNLERGGRELLIDGPNSGQIDRLIPGIQYGHHLAATLQIGLEGLLQVLTTGSVLLDDDPELVINKKAHVEEHAVSLQCATASFSVHL